MATDKTKETSKWKKEKCLLFSVQIRKDTGLADILIKAVEDAGISKNAYCVRSITEKLIRDGYLPKDYGLSEKERLIRDGYLPKEK